ncbi:MAG: hypothetical protein WCO92_00405 [Verrucomicrobiota bacterium]
MKKAFLTILLLVAAFLLTFSSEKVFSMDYCWPKKKALDPVRDESQARFQESRVGDGRGDTSGDVPRGATSPGTGPSEQQQAAQGDGESNAAIDQAVSVEEEQNGKQVSYPSDRKLAVRDRAYLHLMDIQKKRNQAKMTFGEVGDFRFSNMHSNALKFVKVYINTLERSLQEAEAKEPSGQENAFMVACTEAETNCAKITLFLDAMIEDAVVSHQIRQQMMYKRLNGRDPFDELPK